MIDDEAGGSGSDSEPDVPLRSLIPLTDKERADGMADLGLKYPDSEDDEFINDAPSRPMSPMDDESDSDSSNVQAQTTSRVMGGVSEEFMFEAMERFHKSKVIPAMNSI